MNFDLTSFGHARIASACFALTLLPACSYFDDTDPREGTETLAACVARVDNEKNAIATVEGETLVPTYTYDITKVGLEDLQELTVRGSDETAGAREMAATNETSTAVARFMAQSVDEKGAFFLGNDPALYRVRGAAMPVNEIVGAGCERQRPGMRLISYTAASAASQAEPVPESAPDPEPKPEGEAE